MGGLRQPREEASSFDWEAEAAARRAEWERQRESERQHRAEAYRRWCVELAGRLEVAPDDVERATRLQPTVQRMGRTLSWIHLDRRAAQELCRRLAEISRATPEGVPPDRGAIDRALIDAGLSPRRSNQ
jgi:hypothetical protein